MTLPFPAWLQLREEADAEARAAELVDPLRDLLHGPLVIRDLGCGTGSMARWLAPRLPNPQRWVLYDRDPELLARAEALGLGATTRGTPRYENAAHTSYDHPPAAWHDTARTRHSPAVRTAAAIPAPRRHTEGMSHDPAAAPAREISIETRLRDITSLTAGELAGTSLVTTSALLDMLTGDEVDRLAATCVGAGCPALLTLSVRGQVRLTPADPLDQEIADAFNAHQRRTTGGRRLLGPDAPDAVAEAFRRRGAHVRVRPSPWRLGPDRSALTAEWLHGWVDAARELRPALAGPASAYLGRRLTEITAGELSVVVGHSDLLVQPG